MKYIDQLKMSELNIRFIKSGNFPHFILLFIFCCSLFSACKDKEEEVAIETGTVTDIDGNTYRTIKIGNQWWMAENLRTKTYRDGQPVEEINNSTSWNDTNAGFCIYPGATTEMGLLYNWYAVNHTSGLAPDGWHIPTDTEWKQLEEFLGMSSSASGQTGWRGSAEGDAMKASGTTVWTFYEGVWATNSSGFSAVAGSCREVNGEFGYPGIRCTGFWWTATENPAKSNKVWYRYLDYKKSSVFRQFESKRFGFSVRCVKNN